jgi:DNA-binding XRE family transcriptional regulator
MPRSDTWFKYKENLPKNPILFDLIKKHYNGSTRALARALELAPATVWRALHNKSCELWVFIKIARHFKKDTREIWKDKAIVKGYNRVESIK